MAHQLRIHATRRIDIPYSEDGRSFCGLCFSSTDDTFWAAPALSRCKNCYRSLLRNHPERRANTLAKLRNTSITVTVDNVYGSTVETLSATLGRNQEFIDFRYPHTGDNVMILDGRVKPFDADAKYGGPRLIVGSRTMRRFIFTETGNSARPGDGQPYIANPSEFEAGANPQIAFGRPGATYAGPYPILTVEQSAS